MDQLFTPLAEGHGFWLWMNAPAFDRDVAPLGCEVRRNGSCPWGSTWRPFTKGLWGQIFILAFGEHRESGLPIRQKERGPYKISASNGNEVK